MEKEKKFLTVYKKQATYKGATEEDFYYSATRSDGSSVIVKFKCPIEIDSTAFRICNIKGSFKCKEVSFKGENYTNYTYYVESCEFEPMPIVDLDI